ncbi:MarR family transcriptional regulator [Paenibacillaceae bacterium WGS1546]|uniref:MarR family transcriptional regulator n=1 Tax=Cohnella sp. WGS1546 TaxID=3366810 RepID=UPI00372D154C
MTDKLAHKQLLYDRFLHFVHMMERLSETEIDYFLKQAENEALQSFPRHMTIVHVIDCIGRHQPINSTSIAERMGLSKAGITKIGKKLLQEDLVRRTRMNENKKESYFLLTEKGREVYELHARIHREEEERFYRFLEAYDSKELLVIGRFLQDLGGSLAERIAAAEKEERE